MSVRLGPSLTQKPCRVLTEWFDDQWNVVPAVRTSLVGVDLNVWMRTVADLRRRFAAGAKVNEHIVHDAIRAISEIADDSVCRTAIAGLRPDAAEIDRTEESLTLDDPSFNAPIYANLFDDEEGGTFSLIWSRPNARRGD
ncbi:DUF736 family protein [Tardiphaga sp. 367_B4_N1_1]|uniref:DUF736 family protein n=1 Tax=Tardiphaga sp. 367_B4_N1_1 TaxID=3240777 RepID=UPI003F2199E1